jgi:hypothetical protein
MSYGAETGNIILAYLGCFKLKAKKGSKQPHLLELRDA